MLLPAEIPGGPPLDPEAMARALGLEVELNADASWPLAGSRFVAVARGSAPATGFGAGPTAAAARLRAVAEYVERASLARPDPPIACVAPWQAISDQALFPPDLGLYAETPEGLAPFSPDEPLEWVEVQPLAAERPALVPVEFLFPRARLRRPRLVAETSSGAAAQATGAAATLAGLSELIERDGLMLFWYRRPPTAPVPVEQIEPAPLREELRAVQELGFAVIVCRLVYDLGVPCYLVLALRGADLAYGLGCDTADEDALAHAVRELGARLRWLLPASPRSILFQPLRSTRIPDDHYALYCRGPLHGVLRGALDQALVLPPATLPSGRGSGAAEARLQLLTQGLGERGFRVYWCDVTAPAAAAAGLRVVRVLVPGLIPVHFGFDRLRLGCRRLAGAGAPGRLRSLLPHFLA
jgi:ribosomal protein S12 methylthiotransferase accessory factor